MPDAAPMPWSARLIAGTLRILPIGLILGLCGFLGRSWQLLAPRRRAIARENVAIALGETQPAPVQREIAAAAFPGLVRVFGELAVAPRLYADPARAEERLRYVGDWEALDADVAAGRAGLIVTGHLGNWELGAVAVRRRGIPLRVVARPTKGRTSEALLTDWRGGPDAVIPKVGGLKDLLRQLEAGSWIALLADQNAGRHGVFVPFFGLLASTFPTPVALARRLDLPVYLGACLRRPGPPGSFDVHLRRLELPPGSVEDGVRAINDQLETWIGEAPRQYNWVHRRWKTRPPGRDRSEPGQPSYARLWPTGADGRPAHGREPMP